VALTLEHADMLTDCVYFTLERLATHVVRGIRQSATEPFVNLHAIRQLVA
jgi:hypothetical protein